MTEVIKNGNKLTFKNVCETVAVPQGTTVIRVPCEVVAMVENIARKTDLSKSQVVKEMISFAYERTEIVSAEVNDE
jgi:hypothetical protein